MKELDQVLHILLTTHMFVGGFLGFFLDTTIPGELKVSSVYTDLSFTVLHLIPAVCLHTEVSPPDNPPSSLGTKRERGLLPVDKVHVEDSHDLESESVYNLPFGITSYLSSLTWVRYIPFCPWNGRRSQHDSDQASMSGGSECPPRNAVVIKEFAL